MLRIGEAVRKARERLGVTQVQLSERSGISQSRLSDIETGRKDYVPTLAQVTEIEGSLGLPRGTILIDAGYVEEADADAEQRKAYARRAGRGAAPEEIGDLIDELLREARDIRPREPQDG